MNHSLRTFLKDPAFTLIAVITLAIGIGANTAIFTVVNGVLLRPLPYPDADRIVALWEQTEIAPRVAVSVPNFLDWRESATTFEALAAYQGGRETVVGGKEPVFADLYLVTNGYFRVFGIDPAIGRTFAAEEMKPGGTPAAVVSRAFWENTLGRQADLTAINLNVAGFPVRVVGVMPPGFAFPADADVWVPQELLPEDSGRTGHNLAVVGRVRPGVTVAQADAEMDAIATRLMSEHAGDNDARSVTVRTLHDAMTGDSRQLLEILLASVGLVLLIACVNVASTLLARGEERRKELAIRSALGASRSRLVRQLLIENVLLASAGAIAGLLLAAWLVRVLLALNPAVLPRPDAIGIDVRVMLFTLVLALVTPLVFGLVPSLQISRTELRDVIDEGGRGSASPFRGRIRSALITAEVAVALLLLVGSALLIKSFWNVINVDTGFNASGVITAEMVLPGNKYPDETRTAGFYQRALPAVRALPGVAAAGAINAFPLTGSDMGGGFYFENDADPRASTRAAGYRVVTDGYFAAMGVPLIKGRGIGDSDVAGKDIVAVVNQDFVNQYLPNEDPLGKQFRYFGMDSMNDPLMTIVGVVGNVRHRSLVRKSAPEVYVSYLQRPSRTRGTMTIAVRPASAALAAGIPGTLRQTIHTLELDAPVELSTFEQRLGSSVADRRFTMLVLGAFAGISLLLAAIGIYGILAYSVAQRTQEIGIRMALGAAPGSVIGLVLRGALTSVVVGILLGVAGAFGATRVLSRFLFGVEPVDGASFGAAILLLALVAWVAGYIPARRATRVDPLIALRRT
jgi:putative ABC transport system permease protein